MSLLTDSTIKMSYFSWSLLIFPEKHLRPDLKEFQCQIWNSLNREEK